MNDIRGRYVLNLEKISQTRKLLEFEADRRVFSNKIAAMHSILIPSCFRVNSFARGQINYELNEDCYIMRIEKKINIKLILEYLRTNRRLLRFWMQMIFCYFLRNNANTFPQVLCVGVPKGATTWLYDRLCLHSQVLLPKGKELHFFDESYTVKTTNVRFDHEKNKLYWKFKFKLKSKKHWLWYAHQFKGGENKIRMDITPTYCRISRNQIATIKNSIPDSKIILIIRNPVERAWSGATYIMDRYYGKSLDELNIDVLRSWVFDNERLDYGNYIDMLDSWSNFYQEDIDIKYIFYDDIQTEPRKVLIDICEFVNIDKNLLPTPEKDKKTVNSEHKKTAIPSSIKQELIELYRPQVDYLEQRFKRDLALWKK